MQKGRSTMTGPQIVDKLGQQVLNLLPSLFYS